MPSPIDRVATAAAASITGAERKNRSLDTQIWSMPAGLGDLGELDELVDADVVVDPHARAQGHVVHPLLTPLPVCWSAIVSMRASER